MIADIKRGIYIEGHGSFSIDQRRYNFQFGGDAFWLIENGKRTHMLRDVIYHGITPEFWSKCDAVGRSFTQAALRLHYMRQGPADTVGMDDPCRRACALPQRQRHSREGGDMTEPSTDLVNADGLITREQFRRLADLVLATSQGGQTFVSLHDASNGTTRFANDQIVQNVIPTACPSL